MENEVRLVDVNVLKDRFKLRINWLEKDVHDQYSLGLFHGAEYDAKLIDEVPIVDAVPVVHGRWIELGSDDTDDFCWKCSNCNEVQFEYPGRNNYCPNCGAKMDLEE